MIRVGLRIAPKILSDKEDESLINAIDDDGGGELDLDGGSRPQFVCLTFRTRTQMLNPDSRQPRIIRAGRLRGARDRVLLGQRRGRTRRT